MSYQAVFKRYELKYLITTEQRDIILRAASPYLTQDEYARSTVRNIYFDTDNYRLIRRSIERPVYKEKIRIRSYAQASSESPVFVELKKKYERVVYKRRMSMSERDAMGWLCRSSPSPTDTQISREIDYFIDFYGVLKPRVFLSYDREAYRSCDDGGFRVTFDSSILCREDDLSLKSSVYGQPLLEDGIVLMELKCSGGIPMWMTTLLSKGKIYKTRFSKYGTAYERFIFPRLNN